MNTIASKKFSPHPPREWLYSLKVFSPVDFSEIYTNIDILTMQALFLENKKKHQIHSR